MIFARRSRSASAWRAMAALHLLGNVHLLHFDFGHLDAQGSVSVSSMIWSLALTFVALGKNFI